MSSNAGGGVDEHDGAEPSDKKQKKKPIKHRERLEMKVKCWRGVLRGDEYSSNTTFYLIVEYFCEVLIQIN